jgi:hypothetical protein
MLLHETFLALVLLAPCVHSAYIGHVGRQTDCEQFGTYPVYTGPCEPTSMIRFRNYNNILANDEHRLRRRTIELLEASSRNVAVCRVPSSRYVFSSYEKF